MWQRTDFTLHQICILIRSCSPRVTLKWEQLSHIVCQVFTAFEDIPCSPEKEDIFPKALHQNNEWKKIFTPASSFSRGSEWTFTIMIFLKYSARREWFLTTKRWSCLIIASVQDHSFNLKMQTTSNTCLAMVIVFHELTVEHFSLGKKKIVENGLEFLIIWTFRFRDYTVNCKNM